MEKLFSGVAVVLGVLSLYIVIRYISGFKCEYKSNYGYIIFHILGVLLLIIAFMEMIMFFGNFRELIIFDNIGVCIQILLLGYVSIGQSEKYYLKEQCHRENLNLDTKRIKEIGETQIAILFVILLAFWL